MTNLGQAAILGLAAMAGAGLLTSCRSSVAAAAPVPTVPVATAGAVSLENDLVLTAEFRPYQEVDVMAKVAGYVKSISVDIGDHVHQNSVLATLEVPEIQDDVAKAKAGVAGAEANIVTAQAAVESAQAAANIASLSFKRIQDVATRDPGLVPRQEVDVAQSHEMEATAQLASAKSALKAAEEGKVEAESEYSRDDAVCNDSRTVQWGHHETLCEYGVDDSGWDRLADAGHAGSYAGAGRSAAAHSSRPCQ